MKYMRRKKGFSLIEVLISLAIFSVISVAIFAGLSMSARANIIADEQTIAESIARSQIEYVQDQSYSTANPPSYNLIPDVPAYNPSNPPPGYSIVTPVAAQIETGVQKISVVVYHGAKRVLTLEDYKVNR